MKMSGARIVLESLKREGVDVIFGLPGGAVLPHLRRAVRLPRALRHILVRQEAAAGHAAEGYARTSGKVGVCLVTSGPAATNLVTALQDALMDSIPIVAFTGQVPTHLIGNDAFQEADNVGITRSVHQAQLPGEGRQGHRARSSRRRSTSPRPGARGRSTWTCPRTSWSRRRSSSTPRRVHLRSYNPTYEGHPGQIKKAAKAIVRAKRAGALRGRRRDLVRRRAGAARAGRADADPGDARPSWALGAFPSDHPLSLGMLGMHGALLRQHGGLPLGLPDRGRRPLRRPGDRQGGRVRAATPRSSTSTSIRPRSRRTSRCDIPIVGDCRRVLAQLVEAVREEEGGRAAAAVREARRAVARADRRVAARSSRSATTGTTR